MRIELKLTRGRKTDREVDNVIIAEGTLSYCVKGNEYSLSLEDIDSLIVTDSPTLAAEVARLRAENEVMREALKKARLLLEGVGYEGGSTHEAICAALGGE